MSFHLAPHHPAPSSRSLSRLHWSGVLLILLTAIALNTTGIYLAFTSRGNYVIWDFHPLYVAANAVLDGSDPYSSEVTRQIQALDYGRSARPGEDTQAFVYPIAVAYLLAPIALLPLAWAQAAWLSLLEAAALAGIVAIREIWRWPRRDWARPLGYLWCLAFYPLVWSLILGQVAIVVFALIAVATWAILNRRDALAGIALSLTLLKPNLSFLIVPAALLWGWRTGRRQLLTSAGLTASLLVVAPLLVRPNWIQSFMGNLSAYTGYAPFVSPIALLAERCCPRTAPIVGAFGTILILVFAGLAWWRAIERADRDSFLTAAGWTLIATAVISPRFATVNQVILLLPAFGIFSALSGKGWRATIAIPLLMVGWGGGLWFLTTVPPISTASPRYPIEHEVLAPILPVSMAAIWLFVRRIRPTSYENDERQATGTRKVSAVN